MKNTALPAASRTFPFQHTKRQLPASGKIATPCEKTILVFVLLIVFVVCNLFTACKTNKTKKSILQESDNVTTAATSELAEAKVTEAASTNGIDGASLPIIAESRSYEQSITSSQQNADQLPLSENATVYQKIDALGYQSEDILKINYRKSPNDGTSWKNREIKYDKNDRTLSKEKLMSTIWVLDENIAHSYILVFYSDDYFMIGSYHTGPSAFGKYKIENGLLVLYSFCYDQNISFYKKLFNETDLMQESGDAKLTTKKEKIYCNLSYKSTNFFYDNELLLDEIRFFPEGCEKESGSSAIIDGVSVVIKNGRKVLTQNTKFRKNPNKDADTQISEIYEEMFWKEPYWEQTDCLMKGTVIPVYASTEKYETIDGVTSCWYYVSMPTLSEFNQYGWIFGGYFEDYDESKKDEYAEILRNEFRLPSKQNSPIKKQKIDLTDVSQYEVHDLNMFLSFDYDGWNTKVYDSPDLKNEIYTIQKGDDIKIKRIINMPENGKNCVEAEISNGIYGFITISQNPYNNGQFLHEETISVDGKNKNILTFLSSFCICEGTEIKLLPSGSSDTLHEITHKEAGNYYNANSITADYEWVKISVEEWIGWVPASALSRDIGGPTIYTPETTVLWELINSHLI